MRRGPASRPLDGRLALAVGAVAFGLQLPIMHRTLALLDEGYLLALADEINHGKVLYRDVYVDAPFPGAFYLLAGWFRLAGTSIAASRWLVAIAFAAFAGLVWAIARRVLPRAWALGVAVVVLAYRVWAFPHWHIVNYSPLAATALAGAVALLLAARDGARPATLAAAGALVGAGILCKQDYGLGVGAALGAALVGAAVLERRPRAAHPLRPALVFAAGTALVVLPVLGWFAAEGALPALVRQTVLLPLSGAMHFDYVGLPPLRPLLHQDARLRAEVGQWFPAILLTLRWDAIAASRLWRETAVWDVALKAVYWAPLAVWPLAAVAWAARVARGGLAAEDGRGLFVLAWAGGFLLAFDRPRDWVHLMMVYPPTLVLAATLVERATRAAPRALRRTAALLLAGAVAALAVVSLGLGVELRRAFTWPVGGPRGGVFTDAHHGPIIDDVLAWIAAHAPPGAPVPAYPTQPMYEFLAGRPSVGGFHVVWPVQAADRDARIIDALERERVGTIIYSISQYRHLGSFRENAPRLYDYLVDHYAIAAVFSHERFGPLVSALARRPDGAAGRSLLPAAPEAARVRWPFTPALAPPLGRPLALRVDVPAGRPRLVLGYGVDPERWLGLRTGPFRFAVAADGAPLWTATLDPAARVEDRRWVPATIDLAALAGRTVTLELAIDAAGPPPDAPAVAGFADPRLVAD
ncbi:MAG TPA: glycosyltransferase family 39 protein [Candidatus Binatia bacterium]|nr:glycosyltransferase family 39 protein [Candidatus Binatia bacterium]